MTREECIALLEHDEYHRGEQIWADLGCGRGAFTIALAHWLPRGSIINAVDSNGASLAELPAVAHDVVISPTKFDFSRQRLPFTNLDGVLMANSLHFVKEKSLFIEELRIAMIPKAQILIVEYDTDAANKWVPYPLSFASMKRLFSEAGFSSIRKLHEQPSIYSQAAIYSALIQ